MFAFVKPSLYFSPPLFVVRWSLPLDSRETPPSTTIRRVPQPASLNVYFDNARLDENNDLSEHGVTLRTARRPTLRAALAALDERVQLRAEPVTIGLDGFATDDGIRDTTAQEECQEEPMRQQTLGPNRPKKHCRIWLRNLLA